MGRTLAQIGLEMQQREAAFAKADIHALLQQERTLRREVELPKAGPLLSRMNLMAEQFRQSWWLDEQIIGWLVANVPADLLALAAKQADTDIEDFPLV